MSVIEIHGGGDRRSMIKRYERKSKHEAIRELIDLVHCCWNRIEQLEAHVPGAAELPDCTGRSPKDYAIEHAEYMAKCVDRLSVCFDEYGMAIAAAELGEDEDEGAQESVDETRGELQEALVDLRGYVYEFRKRSARAIAAAQQGKEKGAVE